MKSTFNRIGFVCHRGYAYAIGQFVEDHDPETHGWTSPITFFPANGQGNNQTCWTSAMKMAEAFEKIAEATWYVSADGGVRNCVLLGACDALLARYSVTRKEIMEVWKTEQPAEATLRSQAAPAA